MSVTFKPVVRNQHKDGLWPVFIRLTFNRSIGYIKTNKLVNNKGLDSSGAIIDQIVLKYCYKMIDMWVSMLNRTNYDAWTIKDIIDYINKADAEVSFTDYAMKHIYKIEAEGRMRTAKNYRLSLAHLQRYMGTTDFSFSKLTVNILTAWIDTMVSAGNKRCKEMYPVCIRQIWRAAMRELNDDEKEIFRIKTNPWIKIDIPKSDEADEQSIEPVVLRQFFSVPLPESKFKMSLMEFGRDVAKIAYCLGGLYAVDLYELQAEDYQDGIIRYRRAKTRDTRKDGAYMEMRVPDIILPLLDKYKPKRFKKDRLFSFAEMYGTEDSFCANANIGIRKICTDVLKMKKENTFSIKTFRHTWATIARNNIEGVSMADVAFALNHSSGHPITEIYVDKDYSPAWELNDKVIMFTFFSDDPGTRKQRVKQLDTDRISKNNVISGTIFYKGRMIGEIRDSGFSNKKEVIAKLVELMPNNIPDRAIVQFMIENTDKKQKWMYEHQKGKGF